jgi:large subunit ribosomal protein L35
MPKMKTKSGAKKRFKVTARGKVLAAYGNKRHNLRKRSQSMKRKARGTKTLAKGQAEKVVAQWLPNL